jgi:hypothetical protein
VKSRFQQESFVMRRNPADMPCQRTHSKAPGAIRVAWPALACFVGLFACGAGCERTPAPITAPKPDASAEKAPTDRDVLVFPQELRVQDDAVNLFVESAMNACASGRYEDFRRLWSVREEPVSRAEYDQGWQAVQEIRVLALEKVRVDFGEMDAESVSDASLIHYLVLAEVRFDPTHRAGLKEPRRDVTMLLILEQGNWRIARAPKALREWIQERHVKGQSRGETGDG